VSLKALIAKDSTVTVAAAAFAVPAVVPADEPPITATTAKTATATPESQKSERAAVAWAQPVRCADCGHWRPSGVQHHGACAVHAGGPAGLWAPSPRACGSYLPRAVAEGVKAMAERWQYTPDDLAWALEQAAADPDGWRDLIAADLQGRRWPSGDHGQD